MEKKTLLIVTQAVDRDDPVLGFFHAWIEAFAARCQRVTVVCLRQGTYALPSNVEVRTLGKEKGASSPGTYALRFYREMLRLRGAYDAVFVHMNPEYLVLYGLLWRLAGKRVALWYTHKSVDLKLRIAALFANVILTASRESFRLKSPKVRVMGHGIEIPPTALIPHAGSISIITAGRMTRSKNLLAMLPALSLLYSRKVDFTFTIAGVPATQADLSYEKELRERVASLPFSSSVRFLGALRHEDLLSLLPLQDVFLNLSATGSLDKAILEGFAAGVPAVSSNEAFREILEPHGLFVSANDPAQVADALLRAKELPRAPLREYVQEHHSLEKLIPAILSTLS